ncbi:MAG: type VI secretion system baseplate subunit TssK [Planctomycetes bacterium]|nr:type VI secretion system baseplate subunit TssK [Planctomycetota bacterium]
MSSSPRNQFAELHWNEGMLLRPQHFQIWQRHLFGALSGAVASFQPYAWGIRRLEVDEDALENFTVAIRFLEARLPDGTLVRVPDNADLPVLDIKEAMAVAAGQPLEIRVGVPLGRDRGPNLVAEDGTADGLPRRYRLDEIEVGDENTGGNLEPVMVRRLNARLHLPSDEAVEYSATLPLLRIVREGEGQYLPRLERAFVPPTLELEGAPRLREVAHGVLSRATARANALADTVLAQGIDFAVEAGGSPEMMLKLHVLNGFLAHYEALLQIPRLHPVAVFCELCGLAGQLAIFTAERRTPALPAYDHRAPGAAFEKLVEILDDLLARMYIVRAPHRPFEPWGRFEVVALRPDWLDPRNSFYIAIDSELEPQEVARIMARQVSIGSKQTIEDLAKHVVPGIGRRLEERTPTALPERPRRVYFRLARTGGDEELSVGTEELAVFNGSGQSLHFVLYVVEGRAEKGQFEIE